MCHVLFLYQIRLLLLEAPKKKRSTRLGRGWKRFNEQDFFPEASWAPSGECRGFIPLQVAASSLYSPSESFPVSGRPIPVGAKHLHVPRRSLVVNYHPGQEGKPQSVLLHFLAYLLIPLSGPTLGILELHDHPATVL